MAEQVYILAEFRKCNKRKEKPRIKDLEEHVVPSLAMHWRQLGKHLNIDQNSMDILQYNYPNDCKECCSRLLDAWLQENTQKDTTWEILIKAIDKLPTGVDMEFQDILIATNNYLQRSYINSRYSPMMNEWPPYQPKHYTTLALIHHKDNSTDATIISVTQELAVAGKIQPMVEGLPSSGSNISQAPNIYSNTTKNISDIFISVTASDGVTINPCIVLIEGAPGIGKTVLAKEIAFQWANNKLLRNRKILFLLFLRQSNFKSMVSVESFVQHLVKSSEMTVHLTKYLLQTEGKELAIVLDGYDEISNEDRYNSIVADIIDRKIFAKCCLVITSRPTASSNLHSIVDCRVEIVGFTEEDRLDYIQTALQSNNHKVKALTLYLQSNPTINALCYIPLNMTILLCLIEDGIDRLPKTQTDMYKKFIEMSIIRFIQKVDVQISEGITNITRLPFPYNKVFEELAKLAYNALKIDKIVFKLNEIERVCPNLATFSSNWSGLGLLKAVRHTNAELGNVTFHFLHFSIQEYMAALYITTLSNSEQIELLKKTFWQDRYYNTWIMYVGITSGSSFALKHFLSGNSFQFITKIFKTSSISNKYLKDKIKCLHLFQCLLESNNEDMIALVSRFFQGDKIDLSYQTLLPSDVNTLGFFLIRCIYKQWELLDLSGCNIGITGIKILCDRFLNKESRKLAIIKKVDFSYNHLNFSSLLEILNLFKSWHTSELIIKDSEILLNHTSSDIFKVINDVLFSSNYGGQVSLKLGSYLFGQKINVLPMLLNAGLFIENVYLLNCTLESTDLEESTLPELIANQNLSEIHLINTNFPNHIMNQLCRKLLNTCDSSLFVYNPQLPDQDADEICGSMLSSKLTNRIMLIVSKSKIQGIIDTFNICEQLTKIEIFNLAINVNHKYSSDMKISLWKQTLNFDNNNNDLIKDTFIDIFHKINCSEWNWQLRIILKEKDVLIAHKVSCECISEKIKLCSLIKGVYLNDCGIKNKDYRVLLDTKETLTYLYILYSHTNLNFLMILNQNLLLCKEMFVHTLCDVNSEDMSYLRKDCSAVLITRNQLFACNPTTKQVALALQLEPSINVLKLQHCQENFDRFNQIVTMLTVMQKDWIELNFMNCDLTEIEYEFLQKCLRKNKSTVKLLNISSNQLTKLLVPKFIESILMWKVQHLLFYDISDTVYKCFVTRFIASTESEKVFLTVTYNRKKDLYFFNYSWNQITGILERHSGDTLYTVNCHFPSQAENLDISQLSHISKLHLINSTVHEDTIVNILEAFIANKLKISIYYYTMHVNDMALYNFITRKKLLYQSRLSFVAVTKNLVCGFNSTEDQLQFLSSQRLNDLDRAVVTLSLSDAKNNRQKGLFVVAAKNSTCDHNSAKDQSRFLLSQNLSDLECTIVTLLSDTQEIHARWLFMFRNKQLTALHYVGEASEQNRITKLITILKKFSTLHSLEINKYSITDKLTNDIVSALSHNQGLERLYFNSNLETTDLLSILEIVSEKFTDLKIFEISDNSITDQEAKYLTSIVFRNLQLQYFNITNGNLSTTNVIKLSKTLQNTLNSLELTISGNNTGLANVLTATASNNSVIQELYPDDNVQMILIKLVAKDLQTIPNFDFRNGKSIQEDIAGASFGKSQLQKCDISEYNSKFCTKNVIAITKALQSTYILKELCITNNNVTTEIIDNIVCIICNNTLLEELNVNNNNLQSTDAVKIAKALQNISTLAKLYINNNHITDKTAIDITAALSCNTQLQELDISNNWFQVTGVMKIAKVLKNFTTLKKLCIGNNNITEEAADDIAEVIRMNTQLQEFDVSKIGLQSTGAIKIAKALQNISTLTKLYINSNDIAVDAADDIANALSCNNCLQELDISNNCFRTVGVIKIAEGLHHISTLKKLYMSGNYITDKAADGIDITISHNYGLQEFDISENYLQAKGIMKIAKGLQNISTLTRLNISKNNITEEAADDIRLIVSHNAQLQQLNIGFNRLASNGIARIAVDLCKTVDLRALQIESNEICDKAVYSIAQAISFHAKLENFSCSDNHFSMECIIKIIKILQNISTLTKLSISSSNVTNEAVDFLAAVIYRNIKLQEFDISKNNLQSKGAIKIAKALQNVSTLTKLYINNTFNNEVENTAAGDLASALSYNNRLQELDISNNQFPAAGIVKIANALQNISTLKKLYMSNNNISVEAANSIAIALSCSSQLEVLDISGNCVGTEGFIKIANALQNISALQQLYVHNNDITDEASDDIVSICYHNTQLKVLYFHHNLFSFLQALGLYTKCDNLLFSVNKIIRYI